jgi:Uma2 family endonuclease
MENSMSIHIPDRPQQKSRRSPTPLPEPLPLQNGDRLSRAEFERRYRAHPEIKKAELIEGVVYVPSPVRLSTHAAPHYIIIGWLGSYQAATPYVKGADNATLRLDLENEPQPDVVVWLDPAVGGRASATEDDYLEGAPELIVEVAASSASYDMHDKRRVYARNEVQEYLVLLTYEQQVVWFALKEGVYEPLEPDEKGILQSQVFPGLWLRPSALWENDLTGLLATLQEGLASIAHTTFVKQLQAKRHEIKINE